MSTLLSLRGVNKSFGAVHVLHDVDLRTVVGQDHAARAPIDRIAHRVEIADPLFRVLDVEQRPLPAARQHFQLRSAVIHHTVGGGARAGAGGAAG